MTGPVLLAVTPISTEGFMSLITRNVTRNFLPSPFTLLRQVGASHANNPTAALIDNLDEGGLAKIIHVPVEEIVKRRYRPRPQTGYVDCMGVAVRADEIMIRTLRFAPTSVGISPHNRALWSLKTVPCCTESWEYLTSRCKCGAVQRWKTAYRFDRCDRCNRRLDDVDTGSVPKDKRVGLSFLIGLLDPDLDRREAARQQLPAALAEWDGGMVFELALALMPLTPTGYTLKRSLLPPTRDLPSYSGSLAEAAELVRHWPESLIPRLQDAIIRRATSKVNVRYLGIDAYFAGLNSSVMPDIVRDTIHAALEPVKAQPGKVPLGQIGMREAALYTGHTEHALATARRTGLLLTRTCLRANRLFPTLDRAEMIYVRDFLKNRIGPDRASRSIGLPKYAIGMLAAEGLISPESHPYLLSTYGQNQLRCSEVRKFVRLMQRGSVSPGQISRPIPLHRVARGIGGGPKPWGAIFNDLLLGVPYSMTGESVREIAIGMEYAKKLWTADLPSSLADTTGSCSQSEAFEILNLPFNQVGAIAKRWVSMVGNQLEWESVQALAKKRITLSEMSARTGVHPTRLERMLEKEKLPRTDSFGWVRTDVADFLASVSP